jgi:hypothetical protein
MTEQQYRGLIVFFFVSAFTTGIIIAQLLK